MHTFVHAITTAFNPATVPAAGYAFTRTPHTTVNPAATYALVHTLITNYQT